MPDQLEYVVKNAIMLCDKGAAPGFFNPTHNTKVKINKCLVTTTADKIPIVNIPEFKICSITQSPCIPKPTVWQDPYDVKVKGEKTLLYRCNMQCSAGGKIEFATSGQVPIPPEDMDELLDKFGEEPSLWDKTKDMASAVAENLSWWDAAEFIPFVGGVIGMARSAMEDPTDWVGIGLSAFSVVADVAGLFSFGAGNAVSAWAKGLKVTAKAAKIAKAAKASKAVKNAGKVAKKASKALKLTAKTGKAFGKALAKKVDEIAIKYGKVCVFACFPAGTPISTEQGYKNIEEIEVGDQVWAYNEETGQIDLKKIVSLIENEVDATIKIQIEGETIETTVEHPFYTKEGWKKAADLTEDDSVRNKSGDWLKINKTFFEYNKKKVYNFEVEEWHTYFVNILSILVHNTQKCITETIKTINRDLKKKIVNGVEVLYKEKTVFVGIVQRNGEKVRRSVKGVFPVFDSKATFQLPQRFHKKTDAVQFRELKKRLRKKVQNDPEWASETFTSKQLRDIASNKDNKITDLTWHHNEEFGKMELVDFVTHDGAKHTGGRNLWGGGSKKRK